MSDDRRESPHVPRIDCTCMSPANLRTATWLKTCCGHVSQAEAIDTATVSLAAGLRSLAGRLAALSGPVADTGVSTQPMAALPLLGSTDEEDAAGPLTAEPSGQRSVVGGNHAIVNDPTEVDGDLGVTITSAAPSNGAVTSDTPGTGAFGACFDHRIPLHGASSDLHDAHFDLVSAAATGV